MFVQLHVNLIISKKESMGTATLTYYRVTDRFQNI